MMDERTLIPIIIWSEGLIPEVQGFDSQADAEMKFEEAYHDVFHVPIERAEEYPTLDQVKESGYMAHHDSEVRIGHIDLPGAYIPVDDLLPILQANAVQIEKMKQDKPITENAFDENYRRIQNLQDKLGHCFLHSHDKKEFAHLYPRICSKTNKGMSSGWVWGEGEYYTSTIQITIDCLKEDHKEKHQDFLEEFSGELATADNALLTWAHELGFLYWTTWEWDDNEEMQEIIGSKSGRWFP